MNNINIELQETINQLQQAIQFKSFQVLFQSSKQEISPQEFYHKIKGRSNIINIIFSRGSTFGLNYANPITQGKHKSYPTVKNKEFIYTTKIQHKNEFNIFMNNSDNHNWFDINYKHQHWCSAGYFIDLMN